MNIEGSQRAAKSAIKMSNTPQPAPPPRGGRSLLPSFPLNRAQRRAVRPPAGPRGPVGRAAPPPIRDPFRVPLPHGHIATPIPRAYRGVPTPIVRQALAIQSHPLSYTPQQRLGMFGFQNAAAMAHQAHAQRAYRAAVVKEVQARAAFAAAHQPVHRGILGTAEHVAGIVGHRLAAPEEGLYATLTGDQARAEQLRLENERFSNEVAGVTGYLGGHLGKTVWKVQSAVPRAIMQFGEGHPHQATGTLEGFLREQRNIGQGQTIGMHPGLNAGTAVNALSVLPFLRGPRAIAEGVRGYAAAEEALGATGRAAEGVRAGRYSFQTGQGLIRPAASALYGLTPGERALRASDPLRSLYRQLDTAPGLTRTDAQVYKKLFAGSLKAMPGRGTARNVRAAVAHLTEHDPKLAEALAGHPAAAVHVPEPAAAEAAATPTVDVPVPGQEFAHLSTEQLQAQMDRLNADYDHIVSELAKAEGVPGDFSRLTAYQNATAKKTLKRLGKRAPTVKEMMRQNAENKLTAMLDRNPDHPLVQRLEAEQRQAYAMQQEIYRRTDPLFQIDPFHDIPDRRTSTHLRTKLNPRYRKSGLPTRKATVGTNGLHFSGQITPEAWVKRVLHHFSSPQEIDHAARWYQHFEPIFRREFPPDVVDKLIRAFSVSQANASPSGGLASSLVAMERISKGEDVGSIGSVVAANIEKALRGEPLDSHIAAKLSDFIDALRGSETRTWMGHAVEGGSPAPIDIWSLRDLGYIDSKIGSKGRDKRLLDLHGVNVNRLKNSSTGSASGSRYERAAEKYHEITDHLNSMDGGKGFNGRNDWTPAETQALGWSTIQRHYGQVPEDLEAAVLKARPRARGIFQRNEMRRTIEAGHFPRDAAEERRIARRGNRPSTLFQESEKAPRGAFVREGDKASIHYLPTADVSTPAHEWAHFMRAFGIKDSHEEATLAEHFGATELPDGSYHWTPGIGGSEERFARGYEAWIRSGDAPRNLVLEFKHLSAQFRDLYPAGKLPEVPDEIAAIFKSMSGHENGPQILHWLTRTSKIAGRALNPGFVPRGAPRTPEEATAHELEAAARRRYRGFGIKVKDIPRLKAGTMSDETGGELGQRLREHMAGYTDTSGMSPYGYEATAVKQDLRPQAEIRKEQLAGYSRERAARVSAADEAFKEAGGGMAGHYAAKGELKGELPKVGTKNLDLSPSELDHLANFVQSHPALEFTEKSYTRTRARDAILKLARGESLQRNESLLLESIFGRMDAQPGLKKAWEKMGWLERATNVMGIPRSMEAMLDQSAAFRHGIMGLASNPKAWARQWGPMYKQMYSEMSHEEAQAAIQEMPNYSLMTGGGGRDGIAFTQAGHKLTTQEEQYPSALAEQIPGIGKWIHISDRGYIGFLNGLRAQMADHLYHIAAMQGWDLNDDHLVSSINRFVNSATGRGDLGAAQKAATVLNSFLFSPRLLWSRLNFLNPVYYGRLHPFARRQALNSLRNLIGAAATVTYMAKLAGAQTTTDPRNSDFGKLKFGNTRIDFLGGFQQPLVLLARMFSNTSVSATTGRPTKLSGKAFGMSQLDILQKFFANKLAPVPSAFYEALSQKDPVSGQPLGRGSFIPDPHNLFGPESSLENNFILKRFTPLILQDIASLPPGPETGLGVLPAIGIGASSYGPAPSAQKLTDAVLKATKDAGLGKPPAIVLDQAKLAGELADATYAGQSPRDKMLAAAKVFDKIHGTGMEKMLGGIQMSNARAETEYQTLAHRIAPLYDSWLSRVTIRLAKIKAAQPAGGPAPPPVTKTGAGAPPVVDTGQEAAYHVPAGQVQRQLASHGAAAASHTQGLPPELAGAIDGAAAKFGVPASTLAGIWRIESGSTFPNPAVNSSGYGGLFGTSQWNASTQHQADFAAATLKHLLNTHGGNMAAALSAYSGGGYTSVPGGGGAVHLGRSAPMPSGGPVSAPAAMGGFSGAGGGSSLDAVAESALEALASGTYNPSVALTKTLNALSTQPLQGNVQGINFEMPKGGKAAPAARGAIALAEHYLGTPYVWGGESPSGFDCSGLLQFIYGKQGIQIPRTSQQQYQAGRRVGRGQLRPGDAVFFVGSDGTRSAPGHEGIYIGGGRFIEAPHTGTTVRISNLNGMRDYVGARRFTR